MVKIVFLALKDPTGKIQARAILRLLLDKKTQQPILFLERIYPNNVKNEWKKGLLDLAQQKAETIGLPLVSKEVKKEKNISYENALISLGSPAPYEYVDGVKGVTKGGVFEIGSCHLLSNLNSFKLS